MSIRYTLRPLKKKIPKYPPRFHSKAENSYVLPVMTSKKEAGLQFEKKPDTDTATN
jgi:hypothetical protein